MPLGLEHLADQMTAFVMTFFRIAGLMLFAPLFGSTRIPRRVKLMVALTIALALFKPGAAPQLGDDGITVALLIAGEMLTGIAMGLVASVTFVAAQWAGEMIGQQIGFNLSASFDPQFGASGSIVGEVYFMLTMAIFLIIGGHRMLVEAVAKSIEHVPPGMLILGEGVFEYVFYSIITATLIALRLAAPIFVTKFIVDIAMGFLGKSMPQLNIMTAGLIIRAMFGMLLLIMGLTGVAVLLEMSLSESLSVVPEIMTLPVWKAPE